MKKQDIVREANIGSSVELTNIELTIIKTKWYNIYESLINSKLRIHEELTKEIEEFNSFMEKLTGDVLSLEETAHQLFSIEDIEEILEASTSSYKDRTIDV